MDASQLQAAYVLHSRRYGDSSLIVDLFAREQGRLACIAKGALRAERAEARIQPFQALMVGLRGRGEVLTLTRCEAGGALPRLSGRRLYCALYLNELLLKLTARQDPCPGLYDDYAAAIAELGAPGAEEPVLRRFEVRLLEHLGLGIGLELDSLGQPIAPSSSYTYDVGTGATPCSGASTDAFSGSTLLAVRDGDYSDPACLAGARRLMRRVLNHHLDGRPLRSRELFR